MGFLLHFTIKSALSYMGCGGCALFILVAAQGTSVRFRLNATLGCEDDTLKPFRPEYGRIQMSRVKKESLPIPTPPQFTF